MFIIKVSLLQDVEHSGRLLRVGVNEHYGAVLVIYHIKAAPLVLCEDTKEWIKLYANSGSLCRHKGMDETLCRLILCEDTKE